VVIAVEVTPAHVINHCLGEALSSVFARGTVVANRSVDVPVDGLITVHTKDGLFNRSMVAPSVDNPK
jgi:hypothetical protein